MCKVCPKLYCPCLYDFKARYYRVTSKISHFRRCISCLYSFSKFRKSQRRTMLRMRWTYPKGVIDQRSLGRTDRKHLWSEGRVGYEDAPHLKSLSIWHSIVFKFKCYIHCKYLCVKYLFYHFHNSVESAYKLQLWILKYI